MLRLHIVAPLALALLTAAGCSDPTVTATDGALGEGDPIRFRDVGAADAPIQPDFTADSTLDAAAPDADGQPPAKDGPAPPRDLLPNPRDTSVDTPAGPGCVNWPAWKCTAGAFFPCSASCTDTSSRSITCNSAGQCSCVKNGQALSCPTVAPATGCSVCQAAMLGGCCAGD